MGCANESAAAGASPGAPPSALIEVTYFGFGFGRVDPLKQMLTHAGANWKFHGETFESWGPRKAAGNTAEFGGLPIVKIGQRQFDQSLPAMRSLALQFGYYPTDWKQAARCDEVCDVYGDCFNVVAGLILGPQSNEEKMTTLQEKLAENTGVVWKFFKMVESVLARSNGRFICGDKVTMADFCMCSFIFNHFKRENGPFYAVLSPWMDSNFPRLCAYSKELEKECSKYLTTREKEFTF